MNKTFFQVLIALIFALATLTSALTHADVSMATARCAAARPHGAAAFRANPTPRPPHDSGPLWLAKP